MEAAAAKLVTALLSKAWSGSSTREGVANMVKPAHVVKQELPDDPDELAKLVQDRF